MKLRLKKSDIDTGREAIVFLNKYCPLVRNLGFEGMSRVNVSNGKSNIVATLNILNSGELHPEEIMLSNKALKDLPVKEGDEIEVRHMDVLTSFSPIRGRMFNARRFEEKEIINIVGDIAKGRYSGVQISAFLTACSAVPFNKDEIAYLTKAMVEAGDKFDWKKPIVVDKHCIGGLPGNRTTPIVIAIAAAYGFTIPKTSSRAITSPAGTADMMEVFTNVNLTFEEMQNVVEKEGGCLVWGGSTSLSPADDVLIKVEYELDIDSEGQMIASVMSKKIAAGSTHTLIDIPVGPTAKVRTMEDAQHLKELFEYVGQKLGIAVKVAITDGVQPIGNGIGPSLEATDVMKVLTNAADAPKDLLNKALDVAGMVLEYSPSIKEGEGRAKAKEILESGQAWNKFKAICEAQGGLKKIPEASFIHEVRSERDGKVVRIDNRKLSRVAKLAGAPNAKEAGVYMHKHLNDPVKKGESIFSVHANNEGELNVALDLLKEFEVIEVR